MTMLIEVFPDGALLVQGFVSWEYVVANHTLEPKELPIEDT
jgi:hypothetical protein